MCGDVATQLSAELVGIHRRLYLAMFVHGTFKTFHLVMALSASAVLLTPIEL